MNHRLLRGCAISLCILAGATTARSQSASANHTVADLTLEQLLKVEVGTVFGASRYQQRVTDAPAVVSIVTREEIERFGYQTLADILAGVKGLYVTNDRNYSYLGIRGFSQSGDYNTRVLILVDGHRLNETVYDFADIAGGFPVPITLIDRVEVVRGPGSSIYGTNAFLGVVNVITATGATRPGLQVTAGGGSLGARDVAASFAHRTDSGYNLLFGGSTGASDGIDQYPVAGQGTAIGLDGEEAWKLFGSVTRGSWTIRGTYAARDKNIPTGAFGVSLEDPRSGTQDGRGFIEAIYDAAWRGVGVTWRSSYDRATYDGRYVYASESEADALEPEISVDSTVAAWWTTEVMLTKRVSRQHFLTGGTEIRQNFQQDQLSHSFTTDEVWVDRKDHQHVFAAYVQDEFTVAPRLTVTGGVRHDRYSETGSTNLRLAAIFKPRDRTALKFLHGNAFRAPNPYERYYYEGSTDLSPERITTSEVVWEQYLATRVRLSASAFYYHASDLITQIASVDGRDGFVFANIAEAKAPGIEIEAEGAWHEMHMLGSYTFQNVTDVAGNRLNNSPNHLMRARVTGPIVPRILFFGLEGLCIGDRQSVGGNLAKGRFLGNLTASTREVAHARLSVSIGNLFNKRYEDPGAEEHFGATIPQHGRTLRAQLAWRF